MLGVVFIHAKFIGNRWNISLEQNSLQYLVQFFLSEQLFRVSVPFFFFISGYFSAKQSLISVRSSISFLAKKTKGILLPYLFYSLIFAVLYLLQDESIKFNINTIVQYTILTPLQYQFWFLKILINSNLILVAVWLLRIEKILSFNIFLIILAVVFFSFDYQANRCNWHGYLYFFLGYHSYNNLKAIGFLRRNLVIKLSFLLYLLLLLFQMSMEYNGLKTPAVIHKTSVLLALNLVLGWCFSTKDSFWIEKFYFLPSFFSFLIFTLHEPLLSFSKTLWLKMFPNQILLGYFIIPCVIIFLIYLLSVLWNTKRIKGSILDILITGAR